MKKGLYPTIENKKDKQSIVGEYYIKLANKVKIFKYILAALTLGFFLLGFTKYRSEITVENFRYMLKFFDFSKEVVETGGEIPLDLERDFVALGLRNNLAVADSTGLAIYDYNGKRLLYSQMNTERIALSASSKYIYAYDLGGRLLKIFNTYSEIYSLKTDYPILGLTNNASGAFGIITAATDYKSAVIVYNKEFQQIFSHFFGDSYVMSLALNKYGNRVAVAINSVANGDYLFEMHEFDTEREEPINKLKFIGEMPMKLRYDEDGNLTVLTNKALRIFDGSMEVRLEMFFDQSSPSGYYFYDNYAIMTYDIGSVKGTTQVQVFKNDGTLIKELSFDEGIRDIIANEQKLFVLTYTDLHIIELTNESGGEAVFDVGAEPTKLVLDGDFLIILSPDGATINRVRTTYETEI